VHPSERLAALLADELSPDERRALEAELARDPDLRAQLEAMRRADAALGAEARTTLPDGAQARLLAALTPTFDEVLAPDPDAAPTDAAPTDAAPTDELAARRRTATRRTWLTAVGGVAAAVAAVAVVLPNLDGLSGSDDADTADVAMEAGDAETLDTEADAAAGGFPDGPTVTGGDRALDEAGADELLAAPELDAVATGGLAPEDAAAIGADWAARLGATPAVAADSLPFSGEETDDAGAAEGEAADDAATEEAPADEAQTESDRAGSVGGARVGPDVDDDGLADVARCLEVLLATGDVAIPVTAELVVFGGEPAVAFGLVSQDADGQVERREVWVLDRASCEVRYFGQR
jgi:negative regulator of sigma E activity